MKIFKTIMSTILGILMIPLVLISLFFGLYNIVPGITSLAFVQSIRSWLLGVLGLSTAFPVWLAILIPCLALLCIISYIAVTWKNNAMYTNIYLTILKWLSAVLIVGTPIATIVIQMVEAATKNEFGTAVIQGLQLQLTSINFVVLAGFIVFYVLIKIFGSKITGDLNRALTAARTSKELGKPGRTPDALLNFYKMFNFIFPELIIMGMFIALFINTDLAVFLWMTLEGLGVFMLINIWMDGNIRREAKRKILQDKVNQTKAIEHIIDGKLKGDK